MKTTEIELTLAPAMWANFFAAIDLSPDRDKEIVKKNGHWVRPSPTSLDGWVTTGEVSPHGKIRPWEQSLHEEENHLRNDWLSKHHETQKYDHYVVMSLAPDKPIKSRDVECGCFYNDRLFVWGRYLENDDQLPRYKLMEHLETIGLRAGADYWDPVSIFAGYKKGYPMFDLGIRAESDYGPRWFDVQERILKPGKLPEGYETDYYDGCLKAHIYFDQEVNLNEELGDSWTTQSTLDARIKCYRSMIAEGKSHEDSVKEARNLLYVH